MKVLLHICCGPCAIMPLQRLLDEGHEVTGYFYNPNIHPAAEYMRRREGAAQVALRYGAPVIWACAPGDYDTVAWLRMIHGQEHDRCHLCWGERLERTFAAAVTGGFDAFSSTLLYSRYQQHDFIAKRAGALSCAGKGAVSAEPVFLYRDFRPDWQAGVELSKKWNIYRQKYCGCILSENDRYAKILEKDNRKLSAL